MQVYGLVDQTEDVYGLKRSWVILQEFLSPNFDVSLRVSIVEYLKNSLSSM